LVFQQEIPSPFINYNTIQTQQLQSWGVHIPKNINVKRKGKQSKQFSMVELSKGERFSNSLTNENHQALFKTKANEYHCQKKDSNQNNSPWLKSARGRSFDNLPLLFTFTLFHNNNNNNNLSKPYSQNKM
jgi:hypothetical protein